MKTIEVSNARICFDDVGDGSPVLFLHGFPATRVLWSGVVPLLANSGFRLLVPDLVGDGASPVADGVRIDMGSQSHWMVELLDSLGIEQAVVIAHDVGSAAAQILVANAPQRVRQLVVLDGVHGAEWAMDSIVSIQQWDPAEAHRLYPVLLRRLGKTPALRAMLGAYQGEAGGLQLIRAARDFKPDQTAHIVDALRHSGVPSLVIWGERDEFFPVATVGQPLAELLGAPLVMVPGGHFTPLDCPEEVAEAIRAILANRP